MIRFEYSEYEDKFKKRYEELFSDRLEDMQKALGDILVSEKFHSFRNLKVSEILLMEFTDVCELCFKMDSLFNDDERYRIRNIFKYDSDGIGGRAEIFQPKINRFFYEVSREIGISTCFYCNLENVNAFLDVPDCVSSFDFLKTASKDELLKIQLVGEGLADRILKERSGFYRLEDVKRVKGVGTKVFENIRSLKFTTGVCGFVLDHVLPKSAHPLAALSLFNLVPCCYVCNSKLKRSAAIVDGEKYACFSPTSNEYSVGSDLEFRLLINPEGHKYGMVDCLNDFKVELAIVNNGLFDKYNDYIRLFQLRGRYNFYKNDALELIEKSIKYPDSRVEELASLLGVSKDELKVDLFGRDIFCKENKTQKIKYRKDIARNLGLID